MPQLALQQCTIETEDNISGRKQHQKHDQSIVAEGIPMSIKIRDLLSHRTSFSSLRRQTVYECRTL